MYPEHSRNNMSGHTLHPKRPPRRGFFLGALIACCFFPAGFVSANSMSGWVSLGSEVMGADSSCGAGGALYDFQVMDYDTETPVSVTNINVRTYVRGSSPTQFLQTVTGTSLTGTVCMNVYSQGVDINITGGANYYDFRGTYYWETNPAAADGKRMRAHIHLRPRTNPTEDVAHFSPAAGTAYQNEPSYQIALNSLSSIYGANSANRISFYL
ncbi:MAG: hypothetical protein A2762_03585 [Candidatus Lloydbacteria bacterium RIFCSPHIGHO2_01_FULL_54_11]|nr:MAG: hypothetical protein A2762_03585 [Candidatus Lloydbacteria bacterium RIFCSPHIGHO2_01_FULL_54_11]